MAYAEMDVSSSQVTSQSLPISVLDLIPSRAGEPASSAIAQSVELARHVEQLGYKRYWVAEHHSIQGLVCSATPILIGHIAAATKKIRVGSGGVMLPNHAPLVVAEQFGTLESMYPGRIDLGLGRAPGTAVTAGLFTQYKGAATRVGTRHDTRGSRHFSLTNRALTFARIRGSHQGHLA
jgi:luciferase family oxidoreductase group 1